jgi:hypothetical protein
MLVASRVFHAQPRGQAVKAYPADSVFGAALVSYRRQLSQWNAPDEFLYTANTTDKPVKLAALRHVAGVGSSVVAQYGGSGAYFLDQLAPGVWRLEVMPDAVPMSDPFATASLSKVVTRIEWTAQPLTLTLADLGADFQLKGLNDGNTTQAQASRGKLLVRPGAYLLTRAGKDGRVWTAHSTADGRQLGEFVAPPATVGAPQVQHLPVAQATAGQPLAIVATVAGASPTDSVLLVAQHYYGPTRSLPMQRAGANTWAASVPAALTYPGLLRYWVVLKRASQSALTFPGGQLGTPRDWDFAPAATPWQVPLVAATAPLPLFTAALDRDAVEAKGLGEGNWTDYPTTANGALALRLVVSPPKASQSAAQASPAAALRAYLGTKIAGRFTDLGNFTELVIKAQTNQPAATQLRVVLVTRDAVAYEAAVPLPATGGEVRVPLAVLRAAPLLLTPRPYPGFLPLTYAAPSTPSFRLSEVEVLQVVLDQPASLTEPLRVDIESVVLH